MPMIPPGANEPTLEFSSNGTAKYRTPEQTLEKVEGNTAVGNDSNGGEVMRRLRYISNVNGFGRVVT